MRQLLIIGLLLGAEATAGGAVTVVSGEARHHFSVEVADTPAAHREGLMHREALAEDAGMLFEFDPPAKVAFWMRNTLIPLDMLFIDPAGEITHIHADAQPHDDSRIHSPGRVSHVLEINGGLAERLGIRPGDRVEIHSAE